MNTCFETRDWRLEYDGHETLNLGNLHAALETNYEPRHVTV